MTTGHLHRTIHLRRDGRALRLLRTPLVRTTDGDRARRSRLVWGQREGGVWVLTPLSLLHTAIGLTVITEDAPRFHWTSDRRYELRDTPTSTTTPGRDLLADSEGGGPLG